jgi:hypothetical protein
MYIYICIAFDDWLETEKKKFNQAVNASNQIVERNKNQW